MVISYILWSFWYILSMVGMLYQEKSGNPETNWPKTQSGKTRVLAKTPKRINKGRIKSSYHFSAPFLITLAFYLRYLTVIE
jgi:hypothetical protein